MLNDAGRDKYKIIFYKYKWPSPLKDGEWKVGYAVTNLSVNEFIESESNWFDFRLISVHAISEFIFKEIANK